MTASAVLAGTRTRALFTGDDPVDGEIRRTWRELRPADDAEVLASIGAGERAVVALPFAPGGAGVAHLVGGTGAARPPATGIARTLTHRVTATPTPQEYTARVRAALARIELGAIDKVVLGRSLEIVSDPPLTPGEIVDGLVAARPGRFVFSLPLGVPRTAEEETPWLVGASPELLLRRRGSLVTSTPLAGSVPRSPDPVEDRRRAEALRDSAKDLAEHAYVVDAIVTTLRRVGTDVVAPARPEVLSTDTLHHLATPVRAQVPGLDALRLARLLHPTPAVGGTPTTSALLTIDELEGDGRGLLTGAVGWVDARGDGELAVTIRAGVLQGARLRLYAGAGIVAGSDPDAEVAETGAKLATMARAIGLADELEGRAI